VHRGLLEVVSRGEQAAENAPFLAAGYESLGDREEAARWLGIAVTSALAGGAFEQVIEFAERLAKIAKTSADRTHAELFIVDALARAGRAADARERLERLSLDNISDAHLRLEIRVLTLALAATLRHVSADHDPNLVAEADAHGRLDLRIETRLAVARLVRGQRGLGLAEEAIGLANDVPLELRYRALAMRLEILSEVDSSDLPRFARAAEMARTAARELKSPWAELDADNYLAIAQSYVDFAGAAAAFEQIAERAKTLKFGTLSREALANSATTALRMGDGVRAAKSAKLAADSSRAAGDQITLAGAQSICAGALLLVGDFHAAKAAADESIELALAAGHDYHASVTLLRRAEIRASLGDVNASEDAALAKAHAEKASNADMAIRAEIWGLLHCTRLGDETAKNRLREAVALIDQTQPALRAPTKRLVDLARQTLG
jgi:tetratricopeptide (TPR) repeat protein